MIVPDPRFIDRVILVPARVTDLYPPSDDDEDPTSAVGPLVGATTLGDNPVMILLDESDLADAMLAELELPDGTRVEHSTTLVIRMPDTATIEDCEAFGMEVMGTGQPTIVLDSAHAFAVSPLTVADVIAILAESVAEGDVDVAASVFTDAAVRIVAAAAREVAP